MTESYHWYMWLVHQVVQVRNLTWEKSSVPSEWGHLFWVPWNHFVDPLPFTRTINISTGQQDNLKILLTTFFLNHSWKTRINTTVYSMYWTQLKNYGTLYENEQKLLYKINNAHNDWNVLLKPLGMLYNFISIFHTQSIKHIFFPVKHKAQNVCTSQINCVTLRRHKNWGIEIGD